MLGIGEGEGWIGVGMGSGCSGSGVFRFGLVIGIVSGCWSDGEL